MHHLLNRLRHPRRLPGTGILFLLLLALGGLTACPPKSVQVKKKKKKVLPIPSLQPLGPMVRLPRMRMEQNPSRGPKQAPLQFVELFNPLSFHSQKLHKIRKAIFREFAGNVRWTILFNPRAGRDQGYYLSHSLLVARGLGGFWSYLQELMKDQTPYYNIQHLRNIARKAGLNEQLFDVRMQDPMYKMILDRDMRMGYALKTLGKSALLLNGVRLKPPWNKTTLLQATRLAFANARGHLQRGIPLSRLHSFLTRNAPLIKQRKGLPDSIRPRRYTRLPMSVFERTPYWGKEDARVAIVEFSDFTCVPCRALYLKLHSVQKKFKDSGVRFYFKPYPILRSIHSHKAIELVAAAQEKGKYWTMVHLLFKHQKLLLKGNYMEIAKKAGLDANWVATELDRGSYKIRRYQYLADGRRLRLVSVPTMYINGWKLRGIQSRTSLLTDLTRELWKAGWLAKNARKRPMSRNP